MKRMNINASIVDTRKVQEDTLIPAKSRRTPSASLTPSASTAPS